MRHKKSKSNSFNDSAMNASLPRIALIFKRPTLIGLSERATGFLILPGWCFQLPFLVELTSLDSLSWTQSGQMKL